MKIWTLSFALTFLIAINAKAQMFGGKFEQGYYYDINGQKVEGLINDNTSGKGPVPNEGYIIFKENSKAEKQKLSASMIHGFVVGVDSFIVARAPRFGGWSKYDLDFLRVVINDSTKLYTIYGSDRAKEKRGGMRPSISTGLGIGGGYGGGIGMGLSLGSGLFGGGGGSSHAIYYYGSGAGDMVEINKQNFVAAMSEVLAAEPEAVKKVIDKKYKLGDMESLLKYYYQLRQEHSDNQ